MIVDLHNHTKLCNHAEGEIEQYITIAISKNIKFFGFSDHAPMDFDQKYRMNFKQMASYESEILKFKNIYKDKIEILLGYEVDYLKGHINKKVLNSKVDYLIGSVHFIDEWGFDNPEFIGNYEHQDIDVIWQKYFDTITEMAQTRLFDIVGHLDLIKVFKFMPNKSITSIAKDALEAIKEADMSIEINVAGLRKKCAELYPSLELLQEIYKLNIPITFGSDAHTPNQVGLFNNEAIKIAKDIGYKQCVFYRARKKYFINF